MAIESARTLSVGAATGLGVTGLIAAAEPGTDITIERHGRPVVAVISSSTSSSTSTSSTACEAI